ncbi:hypothetical protein L596_013565 [Steinernema carpocapsae]|uniref:Uncharacterized protein n=1 Tax=Steinernema carpocapsae TaxID=34508 RepID=A0A4U5P0J5_STECR|nr:hypothetical protein L596_013565 [Steinernema carpocapsae]
MRNAAVTVSFITDPWYSCLRNISSPLKGHLGVCVAFTILFVTSVFQLVPDPGDFLKDQHSNALFPCCPVCLVLMHDQSHLYIPEQIHSITDRLSVINRVVHNPLTLNCTCVYVDRCVQVMR